MSRPASLPPAYFERLYAADIDPWRFESSAYERDKYAHTMDALGGRRFAAGFEVGCSIGVLTARLAGQCERLLSVDVADAALARARERCRGDAHVQFERRSIPADWPDARFDLIVLSEVLYYLAPADIARAAEATVRSLLPGGVVLMVHYTDPTDYPVSGDEAVRLFEAGCGPLVVPVRRERRPRYRLDRLDRA